VIAPLGARIGRIEEDEIVFSYPCEGFPVIRSEQFDSLQDSRPLVDYTPETEGIYPGPSVMQRIIEVARPAEPDEPIDARPREEHKIVRISRPVEVGPDGVKGGVPLALQPFPAVSILGYYQRWVIPD